MIEVRVTKNNGQHELARVEIENVTGSADEFGTYSVRMVIDTGHGPAIYQRRIDSFARRRYNVLGLLRIALETLTEKDLTLDGDPDARVSPDLARRLPRPW